MRKKLPKRVITSRDIFWQLNFMEVKRMIKQLPPSLMILWVVSYVIGTCRYCVTAPSESYNQPPAVTGLNLYNYKKSKLSLHLNLRNTAVCLSCISRRQKLVTQGLKPCLTPDPGEALGLEPQHSSLERLLTSGLESMRPPRPAARVSD